MAEEAKWYVVHTYSGYENAVAAAVMKAAENRKMTDLIKEVNIPMETVTEITDSGEKTVERKVFPGYVLVKMILTDDSWHLIHNVRGATGFVGSDGKAVPLTEQEIFDLGVERREIVVAKRQLYHILRASFQGGPRRPGSHLCHYSRNFSRAEAVPREIHNFLRKLHRRLPVIRLFYKFLQKRL